MKSRISLAVLLVGLVSCGRAPTPPADRSPAPREPAASATTNTLQPALPTVPPRPPAGAAVPDDTASQALPQALSLKTEGKLAEARALLQPLAESDAAPDKLLELLGEINMTVLMTPSPAPEKTDYTIVAGDTLSGIAKRYATTVDLIKKSNNLSSDLVRIGDRLRIYQGQFAVSVSKTANTLTLTDHGRFFKRYRVGTGAYSKTPTGEFKITTRTKDPTWWRDGKDIPFGDPENILGSHWLGIDVPHYGIHGTWDTNSIGKQATAGCVRLLNDNIAELYTILPVGTPVSIHD